MGKRRLMAIMIVVMMVFAMMPKSAGMVQAAADITPPTINETEISVEYSDGKTEATAGDTVRVKLPITDEDGGSGVKYASFIYEKPQTGAEYRDYVYATEDFDGTLTFSLNIEDTTEAGEWKLKGLLIQDKSSNYISIYDEVLFPSGTVKTDLSKGNFIVVGTHADITPPTIDETEISVEYSDGKTEATAGDTVRVKLPITDEDGGSGVSYASFIYEKPQTGAEYRDYVYAKEDFDGTLTFSLNIEDTTEAGEWKLKSLIVQDKSSNVQYIYDEVLFPSGTVKTDLSKGNFIVVKTHADITPPRIDETEISVEYSDGKTEATAGDTVRVKLPITDEDGGSGVSYASFIYEKPQTGAEYRDYVYAKEDFDGTLTFSLNIEDTTEAGEWKLKSLIVQDKSSNVQYIYDEVLFPSGTVKTDLSKGNFTVMSPPLLPTDLTVSGENDSGYKLVFEGAVDNKNLYLTTENSINPVVKVYYQDEDGARELLKSDKYDLKIQRKIVSEGEVSYEDAEFPLTYDEDTRTSTYKISAVAKEDSGFTGETKEFFVNVTKTYMVEFNSRGGSSIATQYVIPGEKAVEPEKPTQEGMVFNGWYTSDDMINRYYFSSVVEDDMVLYADWFAYMALGVYNASNPENYQCGTVNIQTSKDDYIYEGATTMNFTAPEGEVKLTAKAAEGYRFVGWFEGEIGESSFVESPSEELLSDEPEYTCEAYARALCAVFECEDHKWGERIKKATPDEDGMIYGVCSVCGMEEEAGIPLLKVSNIKLEADEFTYTGQEIKPEVTVANSEENLSEECYSVEYKNNIEPGTATAVVTLKGNYYEGTKELTFTIKAKEEPKEPTTEEPKEPGTEEPKEPTGPKAVTPKIELSAMTFTYNGKEQKPTVTVKDGDKVLKADTDYTVAYSGDCINAGTYTITVTLKGDFTGSSKAEFTIEKAANPLKVKGNKVTIKLSTIKKKAKKYKVSKTIKFKKKGEGNITYSLSSAKKGKKNYKKKFKIDKKTGKLTVKKGLPKGTYKVKVKVKAAGNSNYNSLGKTATISIIVK